MKWDICKYIYENNKLPHGEDEAIRNPIWGISYGFQPILTYMIGAVFMKIISIFTTHQFALVVAARLVSTISMTLVIYFIIKISQKFFKGIYKYLFIVFIAFQPITAFLASYINNDSTALLATTVIIYLWILGLESNWKNKHCVLLGIAIGFCTLTYYNAYGYILCSIILCLISVILNAIIYNGDFLGINAQNECGDKYASEEYKPSTRLTVQRKNESIINMLTKDKWINVTLKSFVGIFGYNSMIMSNKIYYSYFLIWIIGIIGCLMKFKDLFIYNKEEKNKYLLNYIFILSIIIPIILSIFYSYTSDFQPQGRYIMGIIIPFTYFIVNGIQKILEKFVKSEKIRKGIVLVIMLLIIVISMKALFGYIIPRYR